MYAWFWCGCLEFWTCNCTPGRWTNILYTTVRRWDDLACLKWFDVHSYSKCTPVLLILDYFYHDDAYHVKPQHWDKSNDISKPWLTYNVIATYSHLEKLRHRHQSHVAITMEPIPLSLSFDIYTYIYIRRDTSIYIYYYNCIYIFVQYKQTISIMYTVYLYFDVHTSIGIQYTHIHLSNPRRKEPSNRDCNRSTLEALEAAQSGQQKAAALNSRAQLWNPSGTNGTASLKGQRGGETSDVEST